MDGYKFVRIYEESLLTYWENGHGDMLVLISEMQGFLDCLTMQKLIKREDYMYIIDCFREKLKEVKRT